jgi:transglutaminase-like putative cysteine protease
MCYSQDGATRCAWITFFSLVLLATSASAQFAIGLYKDGQLIDTFGPPGIANAAERMISTTVPGNAAAVAPAISAKAQARNQVFADSALLAVQIQELIGSLYTRGADRGLRLSKREQDQLENLLQQLTAKQEEVRSAYDAIAANLIDLNTPAEIMKRHVETVSANEAGFATFTAAVNELLSADPDKVRKAVELIRAMKLRDEPDLTRRGPTQQAMRFLTAPQLAGSRSSVSSGTSDPSAPIRPLTPGPTGADLAETPDVQLTLAIRAKAAALGNNPQAIYEFVRNNVKFQPYLGSRKGADFTLVQMAGNDTDQASLLIALLRSVNIPCRYVRGTIEMTPAQVASWLGVDDVTTAANILATAGLNGSFYGGNVRCTHVWVEAYVSYSNYRGVPNDQTGQTWIPLDPSFKLTTINQGQDILAAMGYNNDAFLATYVTTYNSNGPIQMLTTNIQAFLNTNQPGKKVPDIERKVANLPLNLGLFPASLPVNLITSSSPFPALDDTNRFKIRVYMYDGGTTLLDFTTNLCDVVGHQFHVAYVGATTNDQAVITAHGGIYQTPPYLVNVKAILKFDGNAWQIGVNSIGMGYQHNFDIYYTPPAGDQNVVPITYHYINAGNSEAIGLDTCADVPNPFLVPTNSNSLLENLINSTALDYLSRVDRGEEQADRLLRTAHIDDVSDAVLGSSVSVSYSFGGVPQTFAWTGMFVDSRRRIVGPFGANGDTSKELPFMKLTGYSGSFMENKVFEATYGQRAVSTIHILQSTHDQSIPTCYISNSIASACPGFSHSSSVLSAVNDALAQGHLIIIPQRDFTIGQWSGTGYIDMNPSTGAAGYIISGGINGEISTYGGSTVDSWTINFGCDITSATGQVTEPPADSPDPSAVFCADDGTPIEFRGTVTVTCLQGGTETQQLDHTTLSPQEIADLYGAGDYYLTLFAIDQVQILRHITIVKVEIGGDEDPYKNQYVDRDDPARDWSAHQNLADQQPVYGDTVNGDFVSWKAVITPDSFKTFVQSYQWTADGPAHKTGPADAEWTINTGGGIDWKAGDYNLVCEITLPGGKKCTSGQYMQPVGVRSADVLVIGWINPAGVTLDTTGVQAPLLTTLPSGGINESDSAGVKVYAGELLYQLSQSIDISQTFAISPYVFTSRSFTAFTQADKTYALRWMFKYAGNATPPGSFSNGGVVSDSRINQFRDQQKTDYKLLNHYQVKFLIDGIGNFDGSALDAGPHSAAVGSTKDPAKIYSLSSLLIWAGDLRHLQWYPSGGIFPGVPGPHNDLRSQTLSEVELGNEGRPDSKAVAAFKALTGEDQGQIWSSITFYSDVSKYSASPFTRDPIPSQTREARINTQVYPTYRIYIDGVKVAEQPQASSPAALFPNTDQCQ